MKRITYIVLFFWIGFSISYAQKSQVKKADKLYDGYQYIDAIQVYEKIAEKGHKSVEIFQKLGDAYYFNANYKAASKWYGQLFALAPKPEDAEYYFRYAQSLKSVGQYKKADELMDKFYQLKGDDYRAKIFSIERNYLEVIEEHSGRYKIENAKEINSEFSDYGTTIHNSELIFTSTRKSDRFVSKNMGWNNQPFSALYSTKINDKDRFEDINLFSDKLDSKFNESTPTISKDGKTIYFTRNNYLKKRGFDNQKATLLKIYKAVFIDDKWKEITELPFNSDAYNTAHPILSPDEKTLYFVSDMPGGFGDADIWKVSINSDGSFGNPLNLGAGVNTEARESFPFVTDDNELYFASNGKLGLGGLDIFMSKISDDGTYQEAINVGKPINSPFDDFAFFMDTNSRSGFFSSNRTGGKGDDDIYKFTELKKLICKQMLSGIVTDIDTTQPLAEATLSLFDDQNNVLLSVQTDSKGEFNFEGDNIRCGKNYRIRAEKENYSTQEKFVETYKETGFTIVDVALKTEKIFPKSGDDLKELLNIPDIYFDLNKWNIREDAATELAKIAQVMQDYPALIIDIRSHTDSRQTHEYNEMLSDKRAKATREWLISNGIASERITAQGLGETQLLNHCADGVECSEEEHQQNRRSNFIVISVD